MDTALTYPQLHIANSTRATFFPGSHSLQLATISLSQVMQAVQRPTPLLTDIEDTVNSERFNTSVGARLSSRCAGDCESCQAKRGSSGSPLITLTGSALSTEGTGSTIAIGSMTTVQQGVVCSSRPLDLKNKTVE